MAGSRAVKSVTVAVYRSSSDVISDVLFWRGLNGHSAMPVTLPPSTCDSRLGYKTVYSWCTVVSATFKYDEPRFKVSVFHILWLWHSGVFDYKQWCIAKNGGGYTQRGVAKGLKVPCLFVIAEVSIRCKKTPEVGKRRIPAYTPQYTTDYKYCCNTPQVNGDQLG